MNRRMSGGVSRRVTVLAATLLGVAVGAGTLTGCSDEPDVQIDQADESKQDQGQDKQQQEDESDEEEQEEPDLPEKLEGEHTQAVLDYYEEYNRAVESGDTGELRALATDDCYSCGSAADKIDDVYSEGGRYEGSVAPVLDADGNLATDHGDTAAVKLLFENKDVAVHPGDGGEPQVPETPYTDRQVNLVREGDQWLISEVTSESVDSK